MDNLQNITFAEPMRKLRFHDKYLRKEKLPKRKEDTSTDLSMQSTGGRQDNYISG